MITITMKRLAVSAMTLVFCLGMSAQKDKEERSERREMIQSKKVAYCTERAGLTEKESESYWAARNDLDMRKKQSNEDVKTLKDLDLDTADDKVIAEVLQAGLEHKVAGAQLELEYLDRFLEIVPAKKLALIKVAEREFKKDMLHNLKEQGRDDHQRKGDYDDSEKKK